MRTWLRVHPPGHFRQMLRRFPNPWPEAKTQPGQVATQIEPCRFQFDQVLSQASAPSDSGDLADTRRTKYWRHSSSDATMNPDTRMWLLSD